MPKDSARLDAARSAYREALDAARSNPSPEAWARLLAAGKDLSAATESKPNPRRRRTADAAAVLAADQGAGRDVEADAGFD